ncbi:MAG TPA: 7-carboxy-7-deazaguanine synthase [Allosphingosinicella sp.]|nr:7-carboxy-7-deazaguanine synthase [Allosphingosinicella sp.]
MSYAVKEMFLTLQGEGAQAGRRAVFIRLAGCNLWSGREKDRAAASCTFCDTDFVGTDGENGGRYDSRGLAERASILWGDLPGRFCVVTGGEPMLQLDSDMVGALHESGFEIAMETNGTLPAAEGLDWICVSPKSGTEIVQRSGNELKLVWPQQGMDPEAFASWDFDHFLIQPMDCEDKEAALAAAIAYVREHPNWRLSLQTHKLLGLP